MKTIMVDMDDVLTYGNFLAILEDYLGYKPDYDNIKTDYIQDVLGDKTIVNCNIKIDDKINNIEGAETKLLFTTWHNKDLIKATDKLIVLNDGRIEYIGKHIELLGNNEVHRQLYDN